MIVPDANLLLYAYDDSNPFHDAAARWWVECLSGSEPVGLTHPVIFAFIRIGTSSRVYANPMSLAETRRHVESWLNRRVTQILTAAPGHESQVVRLLERAGASGGNLVTDAQIAAIAMEHRAIVHTADRDFMRFSGLRVHYPLDD
jgi:toxin-antitoxin system PIN domain toxin